MKKHNNVIQKSDEWHQLRKGKITGTTLKSIMGTPKARAEAVYEIIAERLTIGVESESEYENPMDRGNRLEPEAIAAFEFETGLKVEITGFCENDENQSIGYSPDGLISETSDIEVKCPQGKNYVKMWFKNEVPDEYVWQMVQAFIVNPELQKRYFVGYNPDIPTHPLHIIEVNREDLVEKIKEAEEEQNLFLKEVEEELSKVIKL